MEHLTECSSVQSNEKIPQALNAILLCNNSTAKLFNSDTMSLIGA